MPPFGVPPPMPQQHHSQPLRLILAVVVVIAVAVAGYYYYTHRSTSVARAPEHLILGVPYWGIYSGAKLYTPVQSSVYSILQYWGDSRFSQDDISSAFPINVSTSTTGGDIQAKMVSFFQKAGYTATATPVSSLNELTTYTSKDIPVFFFQRASMRVPAYVVIGRLLIGYSDPSQTLTFHDYWFGNNYQMSYSDFAQLEDTDSYYVSHIPALWIVVVEPTATLATQLQKQKSPPAYPERLSVMDSPEIQGIFERWMTAGFLESGIFGTIDTGPNPDVQAAALWEQVVNSADFNTLPHALQVTSVERLAQIYLDKLNEPSKARTLMETYVLPLLSQDLNQPSGEWKASFSPVEYAYAWVTLGVAYYRTNDMKDADAAFAKAVALYPQEQSFIDAEKAKK